MGGAHSREDLELIDSDDEEQQSEGEECFQDAEEKIQRSAESGGPKTPASVDDVEAKLKALKLKYASASKQTTPNLKNAVKLYVHVGGNTPGNTPYSQKKKCWWEHAQSEMGNL